MAKKEAMYRQCRYEQLVASASGGKKYDVAWIPEGLAKVGKVIYFGEKRPEVPRDELWVITEVGDNRRNASWLHEKRNADKKQREASDV